MQAFADSALCKQQGSLNDMDSALCKQQGSLNDMDILGAGFMWAKPLILCWKISKN